MLKLVGGMFMEKRRSKMKDINERFEDVNDEHGEFDKIKNKRSNRPDLHAFLLLDELFPGADDIISSSQHDEFYLDISAEDIEKLTDEQILELTRCGVMYNDESECLSMFA